MTHVFLILLGIAGGFFLLCIAIIIGDRVLTFLRGLKG